MFSLIRLGEERPETHLLQDKWNPRGVAYIRRGARLSPPDRRSFMDPCDRRHRQVFTCA
jgi:hypothetical protein